MVVTAEEKVRGESVSEAQVCPIVRETLGQMNVNLAPENFVSVSASVADQCRTMVERWVQVFPIEDTFAQREWGIPSLLVRLDCVERPDGIVGVYEIDDRPAGVGLSLRLHGDNSDFACRLAGIRKFWPDFRYLVSASRREMDDSIWLKRSDGTDNSLLLFRAAPNDHHLSDLMPRSVSSLRREGDKSYGVALNWWKRVSKVDVDRLPWHESFVIKPCQGTHSREIYIWHPHGRSLGCNGLATKTKIIGRLSASDAPLFYLQPFIQPMSSGIAGYASMMYRIFFGYVPTSRSWLCLGGCATARSSFKIHGAEDSLFLPLRLE